MCYVVEVSKKTPLASKGTKIASVLMSIPLNKFFIDVLVADHFSKIAALTVESVA